MSRQRLGAGPNNIDIYEQSPREASEPMILAQGESPDTSPLPINPWNKSTEHNLRNFIEKRTAKRIKQINKDFEQARQEPFVNMKNTNHSAALIAPVQGGADHRQLAKSSMHQRASQPSVRAIPVKHQLKATSRTTGRRQHPIIGRSS